jgi:hypothetical protein
MINALLLLRFLLLITLAAIFWQDMKDRMVSWVLYPIAAILFSAVFILNTNFFVALTQSAVNLVLTAIVLFVSYVYVVIAKKTFSQNIGIGDLLFFISISLGFATIPFVILFIFSLVFSLVMHITFKNRTPHPTVPLAGYMALFFVGICILSFFIEPKYLFA